MTKLIYFCVLRGPLYNAVDSRAGKKTTWTTGATYAMMRSCASADARDGSGSRDVMRRGVHQQ